VCPKFIRKIGREKKSIVWTMVEFFFFFLWIGDLDDESLKLAKSLYATRGKSIPEKGVGRG
jgi:hypothetical protein